mmetsp:Transcript_15936/g.48649  ORF Transcript_15936/g.48649 Transcript_15936/m.48649 type:complete len:288 (+) Transcript_15936:770-1633(+)
MRRAGGAGRVARDAATRRALGARLRQRLELAEEGVGLDLVGEVLAVLLLVLHDHARGHALGEREHEVVRHVLVRLLGLQEGRRVALHLAQAVAAELLPGVVHEHDAAPEVREHERVGARQHVQAEVRKGHGAGELQRQRAAAQRRRRHGRVRRHAGHERRAEPLPPRALRGELLLGGVAPRRAQGGRERLRRRRQRQVVHAREAADAPLHVRRAEVAQVRDLGAHQGPRREGHALPRGVVGAGPQEGLASVRPALARRHHLAAEGLVVLEELPDVQAEHVGTFEGGG